MKLSFKDIEPFVKRPDPKARAVLIYGPDAGLVRERAEIIGRTIVSDLNDPFNAATLPSSVLEQDAARLFDEAASLSMMGGARLIRIQDAGDKLTTMFKDYLAVPSDTNLIVVEAGELGPRSTLRTLFEKSPAAAALPCYVEDERTVAGVVRQILTASGYSIQPDALSWFAANIAGDRQRVRTETDKLMIYAGAPGAAITLQDVRAACGEAGDQSMDDLLFSLGGGRNAQTALSAYEKLTDEGTNIISVIRSLQNHFRRLHLVKMQTMSGMAAGDAMKKLQPPVFFKNENAFKAQLAQWQPDRLLGILGRLHEIEAQMKRTGAPAKTLGAQVILSLSS